MSSVRPYALHEALERQHGALQPLAEDTRSYINVLTALTALNVIRLVELNLDNVHGHDKPVGQRQRYGRGRTHALFGIIKVPDLPIKIASIRLDEIYEAGERISDKTLIGQTITVDTISSRGSLNDVPSRLVDEYGMTHAYKPHTSSSLLTTYGELRHTRPSDYTDPEALIRDYTEVHVTRIASGLIVSQLVDLALTSAGETPTALTPDNDNSRPLLRKWSDIDPAPVATIQSQFNSIFDPGKIAA